MDVMLHRHCARFIYVVPEGLRELMSDISREVLRSQPANIYIFIADYLDALLITRENARVAARLVQYILETSETVMELLDNCGIDRDVAETAAKIVQDAFREFIERKELVKETEEVLLATILEQCNIPEEKADKAAAVIQHAYHKFKERKEREAQLLRGMIDWRVAARSTIKLYRRAGVSNEEAAKAANLIKAAYKGYYTRKIMKKLAEEESSEELYEEEEQASEDSELSSFERSTSSTQKAVRIDYSGLKLHVDFDEPELVGEDVKETTSDEAVVRVVRDIIEGIVEMMVPLEKISEEVISEVAPQSDTEFIRELVEDTIMAIVSTVNAEEPGETASLIQIFENNMGEIPVGQLPPLETAPSESEGTDGATTTLTDTEATTTEVTDGEITEDTEN